MPDYPSYWYHTMEEAMDYLTSRGYVIDRSFMIHPPMPTKYYWESYLELEAITYLVNAWDCSYDRR